jgi:hypothetical protein
MKKIFYTQKGQQLSIEVPEPCNRQSFFVFSIWKSGSTIQEQIIKDICSYLQIPIINVPGAAFMQGIDDNDLTPDIRQIFVKSGYGYSGFRCLPLYLRDFDFKNLKKILLIRDPRDILVSHYFSVKYSHSIPPGRSGEAMMQKRKRLFEVNIDDHALQLANSFKNTFVDYNRIEDEQLRVFRYEDIVFAKQQFVKDILDFLGLELPDNLICEIAGKQDIFPQSEEINSHIRQVTPGNYKEKLKVDTIKKLNDCFRDILLKYQYPIEDAPKIHNLDLGQAKTFLNSYQTKLLQFKQDLDKYKT